MTDNKLDCTTEYIIDEKKICFPHYGKSGCYFQNEQILCFLTNLSNTEVLIRIFDLSSKKLQRSMTINNDFSNLSSIIIAGYNDNTVVVAWNKKTKTGTLYLKQSNDFKKKAKVYYTPESGYTFYSHINNALIIKSNDFEQTDIYTFNGNHHKIPYQVYCEFRTGHVYFLHNTLACLRLGPIGEPGYDRWDISCFTEGKIQVELCDAHNDVIFKTITKEGKVSSYWMEQTENDIILYNIRNYHKVCDVKYDNKKIMMKIVKKVNKPTEFYRLRKCKTEILGGIYIMQNDKKYEVFITP